MINDTYKSILNNQKLNYNDKIIRHYNITESKIETDLGLNARFDKSKLGK